MNLSRRCTCVRVRDRFLVGTCVVARTGLLRFCETLAINTLRPALSIYDNLPTRSQVCRAQQKPQKPLQWRQQVTKLPPR